MLLVQSMCFCVRLIDEMIPLHSGICLFSSYAAFTLPSWHPPPNCHLSEIILSKIFFQKYNLGLYIPIIVELRSKSDILSTGNLLCWQFAAVYRKIATSCHQLFSAHNAAGHLHQSWLATCTVYGAHCVCLTVTTVPASFCKLTYFAASLFCHFCNKLPAVFSGVPYP